MDPTLTCLRGRVPEAACAFVRSPSLSRLGYRSGLRVVSNYYNLSRRRHIYSVPTMDHLPRLRPHRRKRDITAPSLITTPTPTSKTAAKSDSASERTESPGSAELPTPIAAPFSRPLHKLSPFRVFSRSSKRARESSPSPHKQTPTAAAVMAPNGTSEHAASPAESKTSLGQQSKKGDGPKIPSFLELSDNGKLPGTSLVL